MKNGDESLFYTFYRMLPANFDVLHSLMKEKLTKDQCPSREPISSEERFALTLRYLSSGMLVRDAAMAFRVGIETARNIIHETCTVLWEVLSPEYMNGTHSIVLIAVVDSQYLFRLVNVGAPGRFSDGGILQYSSIGERLHEGELSLPPAAMLSRRCVENAFGILVSRWLIYERQINLKPENVEAVVKATWVLQDFLSSNAALTYCPPGCADFQDTFGNVSGGAWRQGPGSTTVFGLEKPKARNCSKVASAVRQEFVKYFNVKAKCLGNGSCLELLRINLEITTHACAPTAKKFDTNSPF
ncbi:hypothetical protein HPB51_002727 [Rhipicephalus microplus]|uniref:DDE Tnp4 domain-containing protein n=1 Tax=Rhipicephalus microplus TaxID=6941 RepID=A0A9J6DKR4_RHIMP|nr:hypothetical protein HPB51_002727 [Rhipicephalus microplus]